MKNSVSVAFALALAVFGAIGGIQTALAASSYKDESAASSIHKEGYDRQYGRISGTARRSDRAFGVVSGSARSLDGKGSRWVLDASLNSESGLVNWSDDSNAWVAMSPVEWKNHWEPLNDLVERLPSRFLARSEADRRSWMKDTLRGISQWFGDPSPYFTPQARTRWRNCQSLLVNGNEAERKDSTAWLDSYARMAVLVGDGPVMRQNLGDGSIRKVDLRGRILVRLDRWVRLNIMRRLLHSLFTGAMDDTDLEKGALEALLMEQTSGWKD